MAFEAKTRKDKHRSRHTADAIAEVTKDEIKLLNVRISARLHKAFKIKTMEKEEDMTAALTRFIESYIEK